MDDTKPRGFAAMDRERVRELARLGGRAAQAAGTAHRWDEDEARRAGAKGGVASREKRRAKKAAT